MYLSITTNGDLGESGEILGPDEFQDFVIVGCKFSEQRKPSDIIHQNIINHEKYADRVKDSYLDLSLSIIAIIGLILFPYKKTYNKLKGTLRNSER